MGYLPAKYRRDRTLDLEVEYVHEECKHNGKRLYVKFCRHNGQLGWLYHCFSCQDRPYGLCGFHPATMLPSPTETLDMVKRLKQKDPEFVGESSVRLPQDFTLDLNHKSKKYLVKYGIGHDLAKRYEIGYSPTLDRMILPTYHDGRLVMYQARTFNEPYHSKRNPKYLTVQAKGLKYLSFYPQDCPETGTLVLVESALSAIKVGLVTECIGLLGSAFPEHLLDEMRGKRVVFWLDPDKRSESLRFSKRVRELITPDVESLLTNRKPKCYPISVVEGKLFNA